MDKIIKGAVSAGTDVVPAAVEVIEVKDSVQEVVKPEGGFPWCGVGVVVGVVALAAVCAKLYKCTAKK